MNMPNIFSWEELEGDEYFCERQNNCTKGKGKSKCKDKSKNNVKNKQRNMRAIKF